MAGANLDDYNQSVANTQIVGRQIAFMYNALRPQCVDFDPSCQICLTFKFL